MSPSRAYREHMRYGLRVLMTPDVEAMLCGQYVSQLSMDDLEACYELAFKHNPRSIAAPEYRIGRRLDIRK